MNQIINKSFTIDNVKETDDDRLEFTGIATDYETNDRVNDTIRKGAFTNFKTSNKSVIPLFYEHDSHKLIGQAVLIDDGEKVTAECTILKGSELSDYVYKLIKNNMLKGLSIGFSAEQIMPKEVNNAYGGYYIEKAEIYELSVVSVPSNINAQISSLKNYVPTQEDLNLLMNLKLGKIKIDDEDKEELLKPHQIELLEKLK